MCAGAHAKGRAYALYNTARVFVNIIYIYIFLSIRLHTRLRLPSPPKGLCVRATRGGSS